MVDVPGDILTENNYYPFGLELGYGWMNNATLTDDAYKYNGKELNGEFGLNWMDYGARWYDGSVSRWWSVDPMNERNMMFSLYTYVDNSPLKFIDPDGADDVIYLVVLKGAEKSINIDKLINDANKYLNNVGVATRVVQYTCDPNNLNEDIKTGLDKTDAIAVLGTDGNQVADFIKSELSAIADPTYFEGFGSGVNPERSESPIHPGPDNQANVFGLSAEGIVNSTPSKNWNSNGVAVGKEMDPIHETGATMLLHAATHIGGVNGEHTNGSGFSSNGQYMMNAILAGRGYKGGLYNTENIRKDIKHYRDFFKKILDHETNRDYLINHFGNNEPVQQM